MDEAQREEVSLNVERGVEDDDKQRENGWNKERRWSKESQREDARLSCDAIEVERPKLRWKRGKGKIINKFAYLICASNARFR